MIWMMPIPMLARMKTPQKTHNQRQALHGVVALERALLAALAQQHDHGHDHRQHELRGIAEHGDQAVVAVGQRIDLAVLRQFAAAQGIGGLAGLRVGRTCHALHRRLLDRRAVGRWTPLSGRLFLVDWFVGHLTSLPPDHPGLSVVYSSGRGLSRARSTIDAAAVLRLDGFGRDGCPDSPCSIHPTIRKPDVKVSRTERGIPAHRSAPCPVRVRLYDRITPCTTNSGTTRIVFMGTPDFAAASLRALLAAAGERQWQVVAVATQPDRPAGRGKQMVESAVKQVAVAGGLPVLQPASLRKEPDAVAALRLLAPDVIVVAAYGLILPRSGAGDSHLWLHQRACQPAAGLSRRLAHHRLPSSTGWTRRASRSCSWTKEWIPARRCASRHEPIHADDTTATLSERLAVRGGDLLVETLADWLAGDGGAHRAEPAAGCSHPPAGGSRKKMAASTGRSPRPSSNA